MIPWGSQILILFSSFGSAQGQFICYCSHLYETFWIWSGTRSDWPHPPIIFLFQCLIVNLLHCKSSQLRLSHFHRVFPSHKFGWKTKRSDQKFGSRGGMLLPWCFFLAAELAVGSWQPPTILCTENFGAGKFSFVTFQRLLRLLHQSFCLSPLDRNFDGE